MKTKTALEKAIKEQKSAALVVNTQSRRGRRLYSDALDLLQKKGMHISFSSPIRQPRHLPKAVEEAIHHEENLVIVGGGDGTITSVVDFFVYKDKVLGLLPLGTGNSFARTLGIPIRLEGAIDTIVNGKVADVDLGKANDDYFSNSITIGFPADIIRNTPDWLKKAFGPSAFGIMAVIYFFKTKRVRCELSVDDKKFVVNTYHVVVASGRTYGMRPLGAEANADDRKLFILTMDKMNRLDILYFWTMYFLGRHRALSKVKTFSARKVTIKTDRPRYVDVDGEITTQTPIQITLAPQSLKVMVPQDFNDL